MTWFSNEDVIKYFVPIATHKITAGRYYIHQNAFIAV